VAKETAAVSGGKECNIKKKKWFRSPMSHKKFGWGDEAEGRSQAFSTRVHEKYHQHWKRKRFQGEKRKTKGGEEKKSESRNDRAGWAKEAM